MRRLIVDDLVADVRSMLDEDNEANLDTERDILPALNRAQDYGADIIVRQYESPLLKHTEVTLQPGVDTYDMPHDILEQRLEKVEIRLNQLYSMVQRIDYRDISQYEISTRSSVPYYYVVEGSTYRFIPSPTGSYPARIWYMRDPAPLVLSQGRVTLISASRDYLVVDALGSSLSSDMSSLESFVNVVDGASGDIKATLQVQNVNGNKVTFKSTPSRATVLGYTVSATLPTDVGLDDYICNVTGSCVPFIKKPLSNFLVQYAVAELTRKLGGPADLEAAALRQLEQQVERSWVGREQTLRIKRRSRWWDFPLRFYYNNK